MAAILKTRDKTSVGLDIGTSTVRVAKIRFIKEVAELCGADFAPTQNDLRQVVKKLIEVQGTNRVNISVSAPAAIIRYVSFPKMKAEELKQALSFEAQKHIPFSVSEVNLDAAILKEDLPDNKMIVLIAAVKKDFLSQRLKTLEDAGLKVNLVDIDSLAIINAFDFNYADDEGIKNKTVALLNIGNASSNLNILENRIPRLSRDIYIAGNQFTQKIADVLNIDSKEAEKLKFNPDAESAAQIKGAVETVLADLTREIRISFDYYESQSTTSVEKIFLSGAGCRLSNFKELLAELLGIEVDYWDPLHRILLSRDLDSERVKSLGDQLAVAVGLALRA